jgi:hypothetical protein
VSYGGIELRHLHLHDVVRTYGDVKPDRKPGRRSTAGGKPVIRQAISCDICGREKQLTNHWFVAYNQGGELRLSGWNSRNRLRAEARHLCGQTCLHKLVDEFITRALDGPTSVADGKKATFTGPPPRAQVARTDASLTSPAALDSASPPIATPYVDEFESSARLIPAQRPQITSVKPGPSRSEEATLAGEATGLKPHDWPAEAWKRELAREQRESNQRLTKSNRNRSGA